MTTPPIEELKKIIILEKNVRGHLLKCVECNINFTASPVNICPLCEARIKGNTKLLKEWRRILK